MLQARPIGSIDKGDLSMVKRFTSVLLAMVLLLVASPALADERLNALPTFTEATSGRIDIAVAIRAPQVGGEAVAIAHGHGRFSGDRLHLTFVDAMTEDSFEILVIGADVYVRAPGSDKWLRANPEDAVIPVADPMNPIMPADIMPTITRIDYSTPVQVNGVDTTHYQLWITPSSLPAETADLVTQAGLESVTADLFVGLADNILRKLQANVLGTDPTLGGFKIEVPIVFSAINEPQTIDAPPPELIQTVVAASVHGTHVPGAEALPAWQRPVVAWLLDNH
jgi:hypothetical protein